MIKTLPEPVDLTLFSVHFFNCIPCQVDKLEVILVHRHLPLLEVQELLPLPIDQALRNVSCMKVPKKDAPSDDLVGSVLLVT